MVDAGAGPGGADPHDPGRRAPLRDRPCRSSLVDVGEGQWAAHPAGTTSRADMPAPGELGDGPVVVLANELLDNLPVALAQRTADGWQEVAVGVDGVRLAEVLRPLDRRAGGVVRGPGGRGRRRAPGSRSRPMPSPGCGGALDLVGAGRPGRGVRLRPHHRRDGRPAHVGLAPDLRPARPGGLPLAGPGPLGHHLRRRHRPARAGGPADRRSRTQAEFLRAHGIDELVAEGRALWAELGLAGGLEAIAAQSRIVEAEALIDPTGPGGFTVLEWVP